jgi:hypothetical protein
MNTIKSIEPSKDGEGLIFTLFEENELNEKFYREIGLKQNKNKIK